jgi:GAF domain-containing protein
VIARVRGGDTVHRVNELLPETAVEAAFPLRVGDRVIGALDLQSKDNDAIAQRDVPTFQALADHIAIAIDNAMLFEQSERRIEENRRLVEQTRNALRDVERLNLRLTGHAWSEYLQARDDAAHSGMVFDFDSENAGKGAEWTPTLLEAVRRAEIVQQVGDGVRVVSLPLMVRGYPIGGLEFEIDADVSLTAEDLDLLREVSDRFGLAAENARLYEESQRVAQREALINEIGARLQASNNVETTLNEAAFSLKQSLKANRVSIRIGAPPTNGTHSSNGGSHE